LAKAEADEKAAEDLKAARAAIDASGQDVMLVGRSEGFLRGAPDLAATIERLQAYAEAELLPRMRSVNAASAIHLAPLSAYPGLATPADSEAARLVALLSGSDEFGTVAFGTEGGLFDQAGIPTVVCGPGSMEQGHKPDEFVSVEQLQGCDAMLSRLVDYLRQD
jgi:acetylornithine deacetylase